MGATTARDLAAEAGRERGATPVDSPAGRADQDEERVYVEKQINRIRAIEEPTPKDIAT